MTKQETLNTINKLTFKVLQEIKDKEAKLVDNYLKSIVKGKVKKKLIRKDYEDNTNNFKLYYANKYVGSVYFEMKDNTLDIYVK